MSLNVQPDLIVSNMALHWFTNLYQGIQNIIDQLASGGQFIFALLGENTLQEWRKLYPAHTLVFPKHELLRNYFPEMIGTPRIRRATSGPLLRAGRRLCHCMNRGRYGTDRRLNIAA